MLAKVRPMTRSDKAAVMRIVRSTAEFSPSDAAIAEEVIDSYLEDPSGSGYHTQVIEADQEVVGYVSYGLNPLTVSTWDIYWMAVNPEKKGQGFGKKLLVSAENDIARAGGRMILIETSTLPSYDRTRRFYDLQGYKLVCQIDDFYAPGDAKVIYQKILR